MSKLAIFECSEATYLECVQKGLFASNLPWPLQVKAGDYCCLYHYGAVSTLFALWQATTAGGKNLVPRAWGGRFPFQVRVALVTPEIIEIPKTKIPEEFLDPTTGKLAHILDGPRVDTFISFIRTQHRI